MTAAAFHSIPALIVVAIFFVAYQQLENHVLQPLILSRTVKLNPLTVIVAILVGVELAGILGALLAIPFAGIIQVIVRDLWDHRRGGLKDEPTTGEEEVPITTEPPPPSSSPGAGSHTSHRRRKAAGSGRTALSRPQRSRRRPEVCTVRNKMPSVEGARIPVIAVLFHRAAADPCRRRCQPRAIIPAQRAAPSGADLLQPHPAPFTCPATSRPTLPLRPARGRGARPADDKGLSDKRWI